MQEPQGLRHLAVMRKNSSILVNLTIQLTRNLILSWLRLLFKRNQGHHQGSLASLSLLSTEILLKSLLNGSKSNYKKPWISHLSLLMLSDFLSKRWDQHTTHMVSTWNLWERPKTHLTKLNLLKGKYWQWVSKGQITFSIRDALWIGMAVLVRLRMRTWIVRCESAPSVIISDN